MPARFASASEYGDSVCSWRGWLRAKRYWCQTKGSREGQASSAGVLGCVFVGFLGEGGLDMVGFVSLQVIPHRSVGRHLVLDLMLGRSRGMEELMIPFLCV